MIRIDPNSKAFLDAQLMPELAGYLDKIDTQQDLEFIVRKMRVIPSELASRILKIAFTKSNHVKRNQFILVQTRKVRELFPKGLRNYSLHNEAGIEEVAIWAARLANLKLSICAPNEIEPLTLPQFPLTPESENKRLKPKRNSVNGSKRTYSKKNAYFSLTRLCEHFGVCPPEVNNKCVTLDGALKRMLSVNWWKKKIRTIVNQAYDQAFRNLGTIHKFDQIYTSDRALKMRQQQLYVNRMLMEKLFATNSVGQKFSLAELSEKNVSNPKVRKAEFMARAKGFEEYADHYCHVGLFITLTCPSKYHAVYAKSGQMNPNYQNKTPYEGHQYLNHVFVKIRSKLCRDGITPYGLRVVEPQHDGTPHWHLLVFVPKSQVDQVIEIYSRYALEEDGDEKGAKENRVDFMFIDKSKGTATGYLAKYISKNIDGEHLDVGVYGEEPVLAAKKVDAWCSTWRIRQFQQIGGASVTVWRELRRMKSSGEHDAFFESVRKAADKSNWCEFNILLNAMELERKLHPIKPLYDVSIDNETGELKTSHFDNTVTTSIKGVFYKDRKLITRTLTWTVQYQPNA